jgi:putative restriction endonuclease
MKFWWVSHNQTFRQEVDGNYMWSPKVNSNNRVNPFYENMREVARGDLVFSFNDKKIMALGIVERPAYTCPKPTEFKNVGANWKDIGWRVDVAFKRVQSQIIPSEHMDLLKPLLPEKYSPLQERGKGNMFYLTAVPEGFGEALLSLIGSEGEARRQEALNKDRLREVASIYQAGKEEIMGDWDKLIDKEIDEDPHLDSTEKKEMKASRIGQGLFKRRVSLIEKSCRITKVRNIDHLIGSHIKPWRVSENRERLDGENGLLLTPSIDHLFDRGFISFKNSGELIVSGVADRTSLIKMGIPQSDGFNAGTFTRKQAEYLEYHRDTILLQARG